MSEFKKATKVSAVPAGKMVTVDMGGEKVLIANDGGTYYGIGAVCTHEEWDLSEGALGGTKVTCAGHGAVWDLATGKAEFDEDLPDEPLYDVKIEGEDLYVRRRGR